MGKLSLAQACWGALVVLAIVIAAWGTVAWLDLSTRNEDGFPQ